MNILDFSRGQGKSTYCIERAKRTGYPIITGGSVKYLEQLRDRMGEQYKDVQILDYEHLQDYDLLDKKLIIDEVGVLLTTILQAEIDTITLSNNG